MLRAISFLYKVRLALKITEGINGTVKEMCKAIENKKHESASEVFRTLMKMKLSSGRRNFWNWQKKENTVTQMADYYKKLLTKKRDEYSFLHLEAKETEKNVQEPITQEEIKTKPKETNSNKAPGPGDLFIELAKHV